MIAIIAQNNQLASFVKYLSDLPKLDEVDLPPVLKISLLKYVEEATEELDEPLLGWERILDRNLTRRRSRFVS